MSSEPWNVNAAKVASIDRPPNDIVDSSSFFPYHHTALRDAATPNSDCPLSLASAHRPPKSPLASHVWWGILSLLFVCLFVRLRISQRQKKLAAWNFACFFNYYPGWTSPILVVKGQRSRSPGTKTRLALPTPTRVSTNDMLSPLAASSVQQQRTGAFRGWRGVTSAACVRWQGSMGSRNWGCMAASRKAVWWDLRLASLLTHLLDFR